MISSFFKLFFEHFFLFLIVFSLRLPYFHNSVIFSGLCLAFFAFIFKKVKLTSEFCKSFLILITLLAMTIIWPLLFRTFDFSFSKVFVSNVATLATLILYFSIFFGNNSKIVDFKKLFLRIFVLQGCWILLVIINPGLQDVNNFFQDPITVDTLNNYDLQRGFALTFSPFFGVSVLFCFALFLHLEMLSEKIRYSRVKEGVVFFILIFGGLTSGRTFLVGLILIIGYYIVLDFKNRKLKTLLMIGDSLIFMCLLFLLVFALLPSSVDLLLDKIIPFAFEIFYNYSEAGSFSTPSSDETLSMYKLLNLETFIFGDARYSYDEIFYYGDTDSGYMRPVLFFGLIGFIPLLFYFFRIVLFIYGDKQLRNLAVFPAILTLIFALKGETIGYPAYLNIYFLYFYVLSNFTRDKKSFIKVD